MLALPTTEWTDADAIEAPPLDANWSTLPTPVKHTFTHFHLLLTVKVANVEMEATPSRGQFEIPTPTTPDKLPTVIRKAYIVGMAAIGVEY